MKRFNTTTSFGALTLICVLRDRNSSLPIGKVFNPTIIGDAVYLDAVQIGTLHSSATHQINRKMEKCKNVTMQLVHEYKGKIVLTVISEKIACEFTVARMSAEEIKASAERYKAAKRNKKKFNNIMGSARQYHIKGQKIFEDMQKRVFG